MKRPMHNPWRRGALLALALLLSAGLAEAAYAQEPGRRQTDNPFERVDIGVKGGLSYAQLWGEDASVADPRLGLAGGFFLTYDASASFALQPEVLVSMKGATLDADELGEGEEELTAPFMFLDVPLLAKAYLPVSGTARLHVFTGPMLGIKLRGDIEGEVLDDELRTLDWGVVLDVGLSQDQITFDVRYTLGLRNILDVPGDPADDK